MVPRLTQREDLKLNYQEIDSRIDFARMEVCKLFIIARSAEDFYFEELLNRFIGVTQASLNFVVYKNDEIIFHLVNDIKYINNFNEIIKNSSFSNNKFGFFPDLFDGEYQILILHMDTKEKDAENWFTPIPLKLDWSHIQLDQEVSSLSDYLQRCVWRFFFAPWDSFATDFRNHAKDTIEKSLMSLSDNFRNKSNASTEAVWPPKTSELKLEIDDILMPDINDIGRLTEKWHAKLRGLFYPSIRDSAFGLKSQHLLMTKYTEKASAHDGEHLVPNMLVAYRSFTRHEQGARFGAEDKNPDQDLGYFYDTQFLVSNQSNKNGQNENLIWKLFEDLESFSQFNQNNHTNLYEEKKNNRCLYSNIFIEDNDYESLPPDYQNKSIEEKRNAYIKYKRLTEKLDQEFWKLLSSKDGIRKCIDILRDPAGTNIRSLVDSCYNTGLIHTNFLFEYAGLDRVRGLGEDNSDENIESFIDGNKNDLLRVVILFYLFSEMVNWHREIKGFDPRNLAAILVPIKMRGSVWAVTLHATFIENKKLNYKDNAYWMSYYHLATTLKSKNQALFDTILWENTQKRVARILEKSMEGMAKVSDFKTAMEEFNSQISLEQLVVPYALPQILFDNSVEADSEIELTGNTGRKYVLKWRIKDNPVFLAPQKWSGSSTRSFNDTMFIGLTRGFESLWRVKDKMEI